MNAVAAAFVPPPPDIVTVGAEVYPEPPLVSVSVPTEVGDKVAVALAPVPPPPVKEILGGKIKPVPGLVTVIKSMPVDIEAVAVAAVPVPPGPVMVTPGAAV